MRFKEALKMAGLANPGRTTWCGIATDGVSVFTIWSHEVHQVDGRFFAWWDHAGQRDSEGELSPRRKGSARRFVTLAGANLGRSCRAVIVHPRMVDDRVAGVESAEYPHPRMARAMFRTVDLDARQFIAELLPEG